MSIKILDELYDSGQLYDLVMSGLVSTSVNTWRKVYHSYQFQIDKGVKSSQAVTDVADAFGISESMVYKVIKKLGA